MRMYVYIGLMVKHADLDGQYSESVESFSVIATKPLRRVLVIGHSSKAMRMRTPNYRWIIVHLTPKL